MRLRQAVRVAICAVDGEPLGALDSLEVPKAIKRDTRRAGGEAEQFCALIPSEGLEGAPPPDDDRVRASITVVLGRSAPLIDIYIRRSRDQ